MKIAEFSIKRPVFATVLNLMIVLLGLVAYDRLAVREYPNIDVPVVTVKTTYPGASAQIMETQVTKLLEDSISGIEGVDFITSISRSESSQITVTFKLDRDADAAANDVRDRVGRVRAVLPDEIDEPEVAKVEADASPIMWLSLSSDRHSTMEVSEAADIIVQDRLQILPGVASVRLFAERRPSMRISVDRQKMAGYNLTVQDIENALRQQNVEIPSGRIEGQQREFTVLAATDLNTPKAFDAVILRDNGAGSVVRLKDVAVSTVMPFEERAIARFNNQDAVALGVIKQSVANPLAISEAIQQALPDIQKRLPEGMTLHRAYDSSIFIAESIDSVFTTIIEATILVVAVIFLFLRTGRATLIPLVTIPISLIGALALMAVMGFSINTLTLLALVIAIGLVVDDAIVVLENTYRHIEEGLDPLHAAIKGIREIGFAVVAMTLTLAAVFAPMALSTGQTGRLFVEFALTLAGAVLVSGVIALTLTPMMCSRILKPKHQDNRRWSQTVERGILWLERTYQTLLARVLRVRRLLALISLAMLAGAVVLVRTLPSELAPVEDRGIIFGVGIAPEGSTLKYADQYARMMEGLLQSAPEGDWNFIAVGFPFITQTFTVLGLKPWGERDRSSQEIIADLAPKMFGGIPGTLNFPINPPSLGQNPRSRPVNFVIQTTGSYEQLNSVVEQLVGRAFANPGFMTPDADLKLNKPELKVAVDRDKAAALGVDVATIGRTLETMLGGRQVTRFKRNGEQYDVVVKLADAARTSPKDLQSIYVKSSSGAMVPLSNMVSVRESVAPRELNHFNRLRAATIEANLAPGYSLGEALTFLEDNLKQIDPDAVVDYNGISREFKQSSASLAQVFILALIFIYLVLAAQFESFRDPLIILISVPMAIFGALATMHLTGGSLNVYSQIGLVALIGIISKHGIMIVEFANQLQLAGNTKLDAIMQASALRLRPILMTTASMVLGAVPLAIAFGAGAEGRQAIGWVFVGGMTFGTLMTVFVVPCFYMLLARQKTMVIVDESRLGGGDAPAYHAAAE